MPGLERISRQPPTRAAAPGRMRHAPRETLPRHRHREAFAAVVLAGGYIEAGDTGRHRVEAGDVVFHRAFESHLDVFGAPGAEVLVIELPLDWRGPQLGRLADPDLVARLAERDGFEAAMALAEGLTARASAPADWPDLLAQAIREEPGLCLGAWAEAAGLHVGSLSRGFRQAFGATPAAFRLAQRTHRAIDALLHSELALSLIAQDCGFADQAHMTRAVAALTEAPPAMLRRLRRPMARAA